MRQLPYEWKIPPGQAIKTILFVLWVLLYISSDYIALEIIPFSSPVTLEYKTRCSDIFKGLLNTLIGLIALYFTFADRKTFIQARVSRNLGLKGMNKLFMPLALSLVPLVAAATDLGKGFGLPLFMPSFLTFLFLTLFIIETYWVFKFEKKENNVDKVVSVHVFGVTFLCFLISLIIFAARYIL